MAHRSPDIDSALEAATVAGWRRDVASVLEIPITHHPSSQSAVSVEPTVHSGINVTSYGPHLDEVSHASSDIGQSLLRSRVRHTTHQAPPTTYSSPRGLAEAEIPHLTSYEGATGGFRAVERTNTPPSPSLGFVSDGADALTDSETLLEEHDGRPSPARNCGPSMVISATGWARVRPTIWDSRSPSPARNPQHLHHRSPRRPLDDASIPSTIPRGESPLQPPTQHAEHHPAIARSPEGMAGRAESRRSARSSVRESSRRSTHTSVRFSVRNDSLPAGGPQQPTRDMQDREPQASPRATGFSPVSQPQWGPSAMPTPSPWLSFVQSLPRLSPTVARTMHQTPPMYMPPMPPMPYPGMPPYAYHANWSYPELYRDMATAAGLGMGTPFRDPLHFSAPPRPADAHHAHFYSTTMPPSPPLGPGPGSAIGGILDAMVTPPSNPRSIHHDIEQTLPGGPAFAKAHEWRPTWAVFPLKVFLGHECQIIEVQSAWDDEKLLIAPGKAYKTLRGWHRGYLSSKELSHATRVGANDTFIYPQRVGQGRTTAHRNMRLRYLLAHPEHVRGEHAFMRALTESPEFGVEFVERWNMVLVTVVVLISALVSLSIALSYGWISADWSTAFTIASFFSQTFAQIFVLVGLLQYYEF